MTLIFAAVALWLICGYIASAAYIACVKRRFFTLCDYDAEELRYIRFWRAGMVIFGPCALLGALIGTWLCAKRPFGFGFAWRLS